MADFPPGLRLEPCSWMDGVHFVWCGNRTVGAIREIPGGFITKMKKWAEARSFDEAVDLILNPPGRKDY